MTNLSLEAVQHVPLFVDWNKHEVQKIARLFNEHHFSKGETVVEEGSFGDSFFLINSGEAGVFIGGKGRTTLKPGDYFGEIALIDGGTRMASISPPPNSCVMSLLPAISDRSWRVMVQLAGSYCSGW